MTDKPELTELGKAIAALSENQVNELVGGYIRDNKPPLKIIEELSAGMDEVGRLYKEGEYFLSELVFSGEIFKNAMARVKPLIKAGENSASKGKFIMGTVKGDIHDLGKNIVITLLECAGFEVIDLGVDVPPEKFVDALKSSGAGLVGLSALLTTAFDSMRKTIEAIAGAGLRDKVKIIVGGGSTSDALKAQIGADFHGRDATDAVQIARQVFG